MSKSNMPEQHEQSADGIRRRHQPDPTTSRSETTDSLTDSFFQVPPNGVSPLPYNFTAGSQVVGQEHSISNFFGSDPSTLWYGTAMNQFMWTQQMYADYMNQYVQYLESLGGQGAPAPVERTPTPENLPPQNNQPAPQGAQQAQVMNAQGGAFLLDDDDEGDRNRDWLDWAYVVLRFVMLMCILYFYSTPVRFVTFIIASIVFLIYQAGWLTIIPARRQNNENAEPQEQEAVETENRNEPPRMIPQFVSTLWSIVVCFFVSLAPQVPPPINVN